MREFRSILLACLLTASLFVGCNQDQDAPPPQAERSAASATVVTVGVTPTPHLQILEAAKPLMEKEGYELKILQYTDNIQPNAVVQDGEVDANFFQSQRALDQYNEKNGTNLVALADVHVELMAIYAGKTSSLDALAEGATIAIPDGVINESRALRLLESSGLISLSADESELAAIDDIVENNGNIAIQKLPPAQLAASLQELDAAVITGNYAVQAGLNAQTDSFAIEDSAAVESNGYVHVLAVREGDENRKELKALVKALQGDEIREFILERFSGAIQPQA